MEFRKTSIEGLIEIYPKIFGDARGHFFESYRQYIFAQNGIPFQFVQDNHSKSSKGVLRGLHYQLPPMAQGKLVRVVQGEVFDVAVDIRKSSPTFGQWFGLELSADNHLQLWIPPGFAHGFLVLSEYAEFLYKTTDYYDPSSERCLIWNDPTLAIEWPIDQIGGAPQLNAKDSAGLHWDEAPKF